MIIKYIKKMFSIKNRKQKDLSIKGNKIKAKTITSS